MYTRTVIDSRYNTHSISSIGLCIYARQVTLLSSGHSLYYLIDVSFLTRSIASIEIQRMSYALIIHLVLVRVNS